MLEVHLCNPPFKQWQLSFADHWAVRSFIIADGLSVPCHTRRTHRIRKRIVCNIPEYLFQGSSRYILLAINLGKSTPRWDRGHLASKLAHAFRASKLARNVANEIKYKWNDADPDGLQKETLPKICTSKKHNTKYLHQNEMMQIPMLSKTKHYRRSHNQSAQVLFIAFLYQRMSEASSL